MAKKAKKSSTKPVGRKPAEEPRTPSAPKQAPGKALNGGESCFNEDGSPVKAVWTALCKIKDDSDSVVSKLQNRTKDRGALEKELEELDEGDAEYTEKVLELYKVSRQIKTLREQRDQFISRYGMVIELTNANKFEPAMTPKEIFEVIDDEEKAKKEAKKAEAEEAAAKKSEEETGQLRLPKGAPVVVGTGYAAPDHDWKRQYQAAPEVFKGKTWAEVNACITGKLRSCVDAGSSTWPANPELLSAYIRGQFETLTKSEDRRYIMPTAEPWFLDGLRELLARHCLGRLHSKAVESEELGCSRILANLEAAADKDVEAWLQICGGVDSVLNKAINEKK